MVQDLNKRIKKLRKEKGMTQLELANTLNVTDKAVSKWESGDGNPDIALLPKLADILGVKIDYLLTGVEEEQISLDDMDSIKRAHLIVKKDSGELVKKYGDLDSSVLTSGEPMDGGRHLNKTEKSKLLDEIYENNSVNVFDKLASDFIRNAKKNNEMHSSNHYSPARSIYDEHFEDFIKMCFLAKRTDVLDCIEFPYFAIGEQTSLNKIHEKPRYSSETFQISRKLFEMAFNKNSVSQKIINYVGQVHAYYKRAREKWYKDLVNFMDDDVIYQLYKNGYYDLLNKALEEYEHNYEAVRDNMVKNRWYSNRSFGSKTQKSILFYRYQYSNDLCGIIEPIYRALDLAIDKADVEWVIRFNDYNVKVMDLFRAKPVNFVSDDKLHHLKTIASASSEDEILLTKYMHTELVYITSLVEHCKKMKNELEQCREHIKFLTYIKNNLLDKFYIHYMEMFEDLYEKKDYKTIYKFAVDNDLTEMVELLSNGNYEEAYDYAKRIFFFSKTEMLSFDYIKYRDDKYMSLQFDSKWINPTDEQRWLLTEHRLGKNEAIRRLLNIEYKACPGLYEAPNGFVKACRLVKEKVINDKILELKGKEEELMKSDDLIAKKERIESEITEEYIKNCIGKDMERDAVINLAILLEAKLKAIYGDEPKLKLDEMIDLYISNNLANENLDNRAKCLHELRIVRNKYSHELVDENLLTTEELLECMKTVMEI